MKLRLLGRNSGLRYLPFLCELIPSEPTVRLTIDDDRKKSECSCGHKNSSA